MIGNTDYLHNVSMYTPGASPEDIQRKFGLKGVVKLASNENPLGPSPLALEAATAALRQMHRYPDGGMSLVHTLADKHNLEEDCITVHNGSDALIHQCMRVFLRPGDSAFSCEGTFLSFELAVKACGLLPSYAPATPFYEFDLDALTAGWNETVKIIYIANPNNPTGTYVTNEALNRFLDSIPTTTLVIIDEAYFDYAIHNDPVNYPDSIALKRSNVLTLRTFSKAYGLASLRIGYAVGHPDVIKWLRRTKLPFDPNGPACVAGIAALQDYTHVNLAVELNKRGLALLHDALDVSGFVRTKSIANFVMADLKSADRATQFHASILQQGFITRHLAAFGLPNCVRITTGTDEQNESIADIIKNLDCLRSN